MLPSYGVSLAVLYRNDRRVYLMIWRPDMIEVALADADAAAILQQEGYASASADEQVMELRRRLAAYYRRDEGAEFPRNALEVLRQPLEDGRVCVSRAAAAYGFPSGDSRPPSWAPSHRSASRSRPRNRGTGRRAA